MGDAENACPPSKKRAAGRELSRDNPGLDDEEISEQETGTFKRASEEVLANRRIVKVRRSQPSSTPSSNPFAAIRLIPPTTAVENNSLQEVGKTADTGGNNVGESEKAADDEVKTDEKKETAVDVVLEAGKTATVTAVDEKTAEEGEEVEKPDEKTAVDDLQEVGKTTAVTAVDDLQEAGKTAAEEVENEKTEENKGDEVALQEDGKKTAGDSSASSVSSFQQLSSSQNAFTGLAGTGFSSSTFSFGSLTKTDPPTFPSFTFATNGNQSLFKTPTIETLEKPKIPNMQEVNVKTGEENENSVFTADSALFEFLDGGWKERGKGEIKVNVLTTGSKKARLVMRARGNYRLILNASIFPDMKLTNMEKKGITFACFNSTGEGKDGLSTFALKFKDPSIVDEFRSVVTEYKVNTSGQTGQSLKTPENSPKASDE